MMRTMQETSIWKLAIGDPVIVAAGPHQEPDPNEMLACCPHCFRGVVQTCVGHFDGIDRNAARCDVHGPVGRVCDLPIRARKDLTER